jgi:hypothetical protein
MIGGCAPSLPDSWYVGHSTRCTVGGSGCSSGCLVVGVIVVCSSAMAAGRMAAVTVTHSVALR